MENIAIQTAQNIAIEQRIASIGERIAATAIDSLFMFAYIFIVSLFGTLGKAPVVVFLFIIPVVLYHLAFEIFMNGQSPGKKLVNIKVVKADGTQTNFIAYLIRWIFRLIDVSLSFGAVSTITIIINGKGQRVGDIAAGTTVISLKARTQSAEIFTTLPDSYKLSFPQTSRLNDKDIAVAREVLDFLKESRHAPEARAMADKARKALQNKMEITSEMGDERFLQTIIYDYNFIHTR